MAKSNNQKAKILYLEKMLREIVDHELAGNRGASGNIYAEDP